MISPLSFVGPGLKAYAKDFGVRASMFAGAHPKTALGLFGVGSLLAGAAGAKLIGGVSPFGTSSGAPGRAVRGAIFGGAAGYAAQIGMASRFAGSRLAGKLGMYGAAAGALIGAAVGSNRGPNRIKGLY